MNAQGTPWGADDIRAVAAAGAHGVLIPKCDSAAALTHADALLAGTETRLVALIETPAGVFDLPAITAATPRLAALGFGHADFSHAAGLPDMRSDAGLVWHARAQIALAAKARGCWPWTAWGWRCATKRRFAPTPRSAGVSATTASCASTPCRWRW